MKKAFIVEYNIRTRVIADVPETYEPLDGSIHDGIVIAKADDKIISDAQNYVVSDNVVEIEEDLEMPYDPKYDDIIKESQRVRTYAVLLRSGEYLKKNGFVVTYNSDEEAKSIAIDLNGIVVSWEDVDVQSLD